MPNRSSIFSFDTLAGWPRPTRAFLLAIALCAACRLGLYAAREQLDYVPSPAIAQSFIKREMLLVRNSRVKPKVVLMGDSLTIYGLREEQLAAAANLSPAEVVNLGMEAGRAWDALLLMRRNPGFFTDVRLVLFNVHFRQVQQSTVNKQLAQFYRFSTLNEKVSVNSLRDRALMLADAAWPFHSERRDLMGWVWGLRRDRTALAAESLRPAWEPIHMRQLIARKHYSQSAISAPAGEAACISGLHWRLTGELVQEWRRRGAKIAIITMPASPKFISPAGPPSGPERAFQDYLQSFVGEDVARIGWVSGSEIGLTDEADYLDGGHLTPCGASKLTARMIDELDHLGWLPPPTSFAQRP